MMKGSESLDDQNDELSGHQFNEVEEEVQKYIR
jgi:hypothetical protein